MAEAHDRPPEQFHLRLRRYDPESGDAPYWDEHTVELEPHRSVLEAVLQARDRFDGSIGDPLLLPAGDLRVVRRSRQRRTGAGLPHPPRRGAQQRRRRRDRDRTDGQHARAQGPDRRHGRGPLEEDPARHAVAARQAAGARARVHRPERLDGRRHPVDGLHPVRCLRLGLPGDGGRPRLHRPGGARQGLPLRRRPARRRAARASQRPRPGPTGDLRLHPLLQVRRGLPEGRQPDGPDHAPAPDRDLRPAHRRPQQRRAPRGRLHDADQGQRPALGGRAAAALLRRQLVVRQVPSGGRQRADQLAARSS